MTKRPFLWLGRFYFKLIYFIDGILCPLYFKMFFIIFLKLIIQVINSLPKT